MSPELSMSLETELMYCKNFIMLARYHSSPYPGVRVTRANQTCFGLIRSHQIRLLSNLVPDLTFDGHENQTSKQLAYGLTEDFRSY